MKRIVKEFEFSEEQLKEVSRLAEECGLCNETVEILYGRGVRDKESIFSFMHPSKQHFISPFKMQGMREAVQLIARARDEGWSVVVYGDYDADGICAATIMRNALTEFGIEPYVCVPERRNGYGLSAALIDEIFNEYFPQLFITVDCGISCAEEVEYIKEMGAEVIVTDHHELPEIIPDCICVNPKFRDDYIYDNLCGAGVAFKLACALNGEKAYDLLDFAAIATVADSVPLTGENRDIVYEGLKLFNSKPSKCYTQFLGKQDAVTSQTLAFTIAPKINAAGRMGDAKAALALFGETDETNIFNLSAKLTEYNLMRQKYCDELYASAKQALSESGSVGNVIMLCNEGWNAGFVGIVAARLTEEYSRPAILFVKNGNMMKGSARSVENVNIFEALRACSEYIEEFGGHSQAAGVNVKEENFAKLHEALEKYISENYSAEDFIPSVFINGKLNGTYSARFAKELEMLEPYGVGNRRPLFEVEERAVETRLVKAQSQHIAVKSNKIDLMYFGGSKFSGLIESSAPKKFIFEYNVSTFRGREYIKGFIRDMIYSHEAADYATEEIAMNAINTLALPSVDCKLKYITKEDIERELAECNSFGTLFVAWERESVSKYAGTAKLDCDLFIPTAKNFATAVLVSPFKEADFSGYKRIIFLDNPVGVRLPALAGRTVEVCAEIPRPEFVKHLTASREELLRVFSAIIHNEPFLEGADASEVAKKQRLGFEKLQFMFALKVFEQLSLVSFSDGRLKVKRGVKTDLTNSEIFNAVREFKAE